MTDNVIAKAVAEELAGIVEPIARDIVFELKRVGACLSERNKRDAARYELAGVEAALKHEANVTGTANKTETRQLEKRKRELVALLQGLDVDDVRGVS